MNMLYSYLKDDENGDSHAVKIGILNIIEFTSYQYLHLV